MSRHTDNFNKLKLDIRVLDWDLTSWGCCYYYNPRPLVGPHPSTDPLKFSYSGNWNHAIGFMGDFYLSKVKIVLSDRAVFVRPWKQFPWVLVILSKLPVAEKKSLFYRSRKFLIRKAFLLWPVTVFESEWRQRTVTFSYQSLVGLA